MDAPSELELSLSRVFRKTSKIVWRVAGLTLSLSVCCWSDGSTPNASPMHWTFELMRPYISISRCCEKKIEISVLATSRLSLSSALTVPSLMDWLRNSIIESTSCCCFSDMARLVWVGL